MKTRLEIDEDVGHEKRFWVVQRVSWILMFLLILASVAGFLGPGLFSKKTAGDPSSFYAEFDRVVRTEKAMTLTLSVAGGPAASGPVVRIKADKAYFEDMYVQQIVPAPDSVKAGPGVLVFSFVTTTPGQPFIAEFRMRPQHARRLTGVFETGSGRAVRIEQLVLP